MQISFHGAAQCVTGSKHIIHLNDGRKILLDCGMFQGMGRDTDTLNRFWGFEPKDISIMVLSHAHIDHSGLIPKLCKDGFVGKIICTPATKELTAILLEDSAVIQRDDAKFSNKRRARQGLLLLEPLYTEDDAANSIKQLAVQEYGVWQKIADGIELQYTDAGHIIGSACVHLRIQENGVMHRITFSGDLGRYRDIILKSPEAFDQADYIIMESTYGNKLHDDAFTTPDTLLKYITDTCIERKGKLVIPAFSVGRTQEILYSLNQLELESRLPSLPYYVDSPLSVEATEVIKSYPQY
jgi:metallo-beta-lactamase family protein